MFGMDVYRRARGSLWQSNKMPTFSIISPLDQPTGKRRLLDDLKKNLSSSDFQSFGMSVAFAKVGPFYRLQSHLSKWKAAGKKSCAVFGIDHYGTSKQALEFALRHLDQVYFTQYRGHSFHPKIYWFEGVAKGVIFIGSNNLTVGGTEINFEAGVEMIFDLPRETDVFKNAMTAFSDLLDPTCIPTRVLTATVLAELEAAGLLLDETKKQSALPGSPRVIYPSKPVAKMPFKPQSSLPAATVFGPVVKKSALETKAAAIAAQAKVVDVTKPLIPVGGVAMQIRPHNNGEIFLSKTAAQQNPAFFGMPFTGKTVPKKAGNAAYPQRVPDPICDITVFGAGNSIIFNAKNFPLNTVFYESKAEIRVTASALVQHVPEYSILVMAPSSSPGVDYEMQIFTQASPDFAAWLSVCDQEMPGGGKTPRKFGWF
jgi:HKD family nuclease